MYKLSKNELKKVINRRKSEYEVFVCVCYCSSDYACVFWVYTTKFLGSLLLSRQFVRNAFKHKCSHNIALGKVRPSRLKYVC